MLLISSSSSILFLTQKYGKKDLSCKQSCESKKMGFRGPAFSLLFPSTTAQYMPPIHSYLPTTYFVRPYITPRLHPSRSTVCIVPSLPTGDFMLWEFSYLSSLPFFSPFVVHEKYTQGERWCGWVILSRSAGSADDRKR